MLCSTCTGMSLRLLQEPVVRVRESGWHRIVGLICSRCGSAVQDFGIPELFRAKVRQLEQFGFSYDR
jgi:hypothetical protein